MWLGRVCVWLVFDEGRSNSILGVLSWKRNDNRWSKKQAPGQLFPNTSLWREGCVRMVTCFWKFRRRPGLWPMMAFIFWAVGDNWFGKKSNYEKELRWGSRQMQGGMSEYCKCGMCRAASVYMWQSLQLSPEPRVSAGFPEAGKGLYFFSVCSGVPECQERAAKPGCFPNVYTQQINTVNTIITRQNNCAGHQISTEFIKVLIHTVLLIVLLGNGTKFKVVLCLLVITQWVHISGMVV
jgi:hypothetical protein